MPNELGVRGDLPEIVRRQLRPADHGQRDLWAQFTDGFGEDVETFRKIDVTDEEDAQRPTGRQTARPAETGRRERRRHHETAGCIETGGGEGTQGVGGVDDQAVGQGHLLAEPVPEARRGHGRRRPRPGIRRISRGARRVPNGAGVDLHVDCPRADLTGQAELLEVTAGVTENRGALRETAATEDLGREATEAFPLG